MVLKKAFKTTLKTAHPYLPLYFPLICSLSQDIKPNCDGAVAGRLVIGSRHAYMIDVCWVKACMTASEHRHRCSSVRSITSVQSCTNTFQGKSQLCYLPHGLKLRTKGAIK